MSTQSSARWFDRRRRTRQLGFGIAALGLTIGLTMGVLAWEGQVGEGSPFRGRRLFEEKRCSTCHSVWGHGGTLGPEISTVVAGKSFYELVGDFWNHTPQMIDEVERHGYPWPTLDAAEMADMLAYLYYLQLFDEPGSVERGAGAYARLQCASCHTLGGRGGPGGGALDRFSAYPAPTPLAQAMWNAGPRMRQDQISRGVAIPQLANHDIADLQAYIRAEGHRAGREIAFQPLPNPTRGAAVYRAKSCGACHDGSGRTAPDLRRSTLARTVSEITGLLWNHSYAMGAQMAARGVAFPRFQGSEMSDLIAHLYFLRYAGGDGDAGRGAAVFRGKGCASCHKEKAEGTPSLTEILKRSDSAGLASSMWNHAPQMHTTMAERSSFWPKFEPGEMRDLAAYLRSLGR